MNGMILAAGLGTRLRPLTEKLPKPAVPFLNVPMLLFNEYLLRELDLKKIVINTHHLPEKIHPLVQRFKDPRSVFWSQESPIVLGSGGGIWFAKSHLSGPEDFIVCNGDNILLPQIQGLLKKFVEFHRKEGALATLMVTAHPGVGTQFKGVWSDSKNKVVDISLKCPSPGTRGRHFVGLQMFSPRIFNYLPEGESNIFTDAVVPAIERGEKVATFEAPVQWFETGNEADYLQATHFAFQLLWNSQETVAKKFLKTVLKVHGGLDVPKRGQPLIGKKCEIAKTAKLSGFVVLGNSVKISEKVALKNVVVLDDVTIPTDTKIENRLIF